MDIQLKKGILEICVLSVLERGESYGYQIIDEMKDVMEISESTLYPILKRLEGAGYLTTRTAEYSGRLRRYYKITPPGLEKLYSGRADMQEINVICKKIFGGKL